MASSRRKLLMEEMGRMSADEYKAADKTPLVIVADEVRSLNNIGSLFRTADAFRLEKIYLCGAMGVPPHPEIHKTALGAEFSVDWQAADSTLDVVRDLKSKGYFTMALEQAVGSVMLNDVAGLNIPSGAHIALVAGNEIHGVNQAVVDECDICLEIPQFGTKHSLNVSVSTGIAIWEIVSKLLMK